MAQAARDAAPSDAQMFPGGSALALASLPPGPLDAKRDDAKLVSRGLQGMLLWVCKGCPLLSGSNIAGLRASTQLPGLVASARGRGGTQ